MDHIDRSDDTTYTCTSAGTCMVLFEEHHALLGAFLVTMSHSQPFPCG